MSESKWEGADMLQNPEPKYGWVKLDLLAPFEQNPREHSAEQVAQIAASIKEFRFLNPVIIDANHTIIAGHGRVLAARSLGMEEVPCIMADHLTPTQVQAYCIADNQIGLTSTWNSELLKVNYLELQKANFDMPLLGFSQENMKLLSSAETQLQGHPAPRLGSLSEKFGVAPFSVLNARDGWWQDRKKAWMSLGIKSEEGRGANLLKFSKTAQLKKPNAKPVLFDQSQKGLNRILQQGRGGEGVKTGTSVFDPVLCELAYRWFCPPGGFVFDPFAGGSVRGVVAARLGRSYLGIDLRPEQVEANRNQWREMLETTPCEVSPEWIAGDSTNLLDLTTGFKQWDFLFSCPPYANLEVYSDDPKDLSTMDYPDFKAAYFDIIFKACRGLANDSFACFVVGEVRDKQNGGRYLNFVGDTIAAFEAAGLAYYNEAILVTAVGTLAIRAPGFFEKSRKLGKTHQNILIFCKGDPIAATQRIGAVEFGEMPVDAMETEDPLEDEQPEVEYVTDL